MVNRVITKIRIARLEKNYSQDYLASKFGISQSYYAKIESGKSEITIKLFLEIIEILEIDLIDFFKLLKTSKVYQ